MKPGEIIAYAILMVAVLATFVVLHERGMEEQSIRATIEAEVKAEFARQYRNVPRISVEKVYTLHATGKDVVIDAAVDPENPEQP